MASAAAPTEYFPGINFNLEFFTAADSSVTLSYVNNNFLRCTGYAYSRAIATTFNGILYCLGGIDTTTITASGLITSSTGFQGNGAQLTNLNASNISGGTLNVNIGGTGLSTLAAGRLLIGNDTNPISTTSNLVYDTATNTLHPINISANGSKLTNLNVSNVTDGTLTVARGGTGATNFTAGRLLLGNGTTNITENGNLTWDSAVNTLTVTGTATATAMSATGMGTNTLSVTGTSTLATVNATLFSGSGASLTLLNATNISSGVLNVAYGGTGTTTFGMNRILYGAGGNGAIATLADLTFDGSTLTCYGEFATYKGLMWMNQNSRLSRVLAANDFSTGSAIGDIVLISDAKLHLVGGSTGTTAPGLTINAVNNVGIGIINPAANDKLTVSGNTKITGTATIDTNLVVGGSVGIIGVSQFTGNVGIGITPTAPLHLYHSTNARLLLDTTTSGTGSIEFRRGTGFDIQNDYRFINDTDSFIKLQYENNQQYYGDATAQMAWFTPTYSIIHKNTQMNGRVGIGTTFHATRSLEVLGDANISGTLSSGGLSVSGVANISNSTANTTTLTIQNNFSSGAITATPTSTGTTGIYTYMVFTYTTDNTGTGQTLYSISVPTGGVNCDILMVGGGGAGGQSLGGGGGGGSVIYGTNITITSGSYNIYVGRGANAGETIGKSTTGFGAIMLGGGCAGNTGWDPPNTSGDGNIGGSGAGGRPVQSNIRVMLGGGVGSSTKGTILSTATLYNGNSGSNGIQQLGNSFVGGGGGGGATQAGGTVNVVSYIGGKGGDGVEVNITGTSYWWGAGGGGSTYAGTNGGGGKGGGGSAGTVGTNGINPASGINAGAGTGSGGGGQIFQVYTGGAGGSGIIIIRFITPTSSSSIELLRGTNIDSKTDYRIGNYDGTFKVIKSLNNGDTDVLTINQTTNNITAPANITANSLTAVSGITSSSGGITASSGNIIASTGNISASSGTLTGYNLTATNHISTNTLTATGNIVAPTFNSITLYNDFLRKSDCVRYVAATTRTVVLIPAGGFFGGVGGNLWTSVFHTQVNLVRSEYDRPSGVNFRLYMAFSSANTDSTYSYGFFKIAYDQQRNVISQNIDAPSTNDFTITSNFDGAGGCRVVITIANANSPTHINVNIA
jgi:hypothetical protein